MKKHLCILSLVVVTLLSGCGHMNFPAGRAYFDENASSHHHKTPNYHSAVHYHTLKPPVYRRLDYKRSGYTTGYRSKLPRRRHESVQHLGLNTQGVRH